jgi:hypothetical protein
MLGDVPLGQARPPFAVPRVDSLVRGQMPAVERRVIFDVAVFDRRVLRNVPFSAAKWCRRLPCRRMVPRSGCGPTED